MAGQKRKADGSPSQRPPLSHPETRTTTVQKFKSQTVDDGAAPKKTPRWLKKPLPVQPVGEARITRSMIAGAPAQAVFATAELMENILIHLPNHKILTSQRICRQCRDVVKTSVLVQQKLFLRTHGNGTESWKQLPNSSFVRTTDTPDVLVSQEVSPEQVINFVAASGYNPLFTRIAKVAIPIKRPRRGRRPNSRRPLGPSCLISAGLHLRVALRLSLRGRPIPRILYDMHLTDSTAVRTFIYVHWVIGEIEGKTSVSCGKPSGVTVGMVLEAIRDKPTDYSDVWIVSRGHDAWTLGKMVQLDKSGATLRIKKFEVSFPGLLLPNEADREACLPLP